MEIIFEDLVYALNNNLNSVVYLEEFNYSFVSGKSYALFGNAKEIVGKLLVLEKRPTKGSIVINGQVIKKTLKVDNIDKLKKDLVYIDFSNKYKFAKNYFLEELEFLFRSKNVKGKSNLDKLALEALMMVGLAEEYLSKELWNLSTSESKKVLLALYLCLNPKVLVLKDLDYGLIYKDKQNLKRLLNRLKIRYGKTIVYITEDVKFLFDAVDKILVINNGVVVIDGDKDEFYNEKLYNFVEKPKIVDFIEYANTKKHKILPYTDIKELIKGIYRDVENKK